MSIKLRLIKVLKFFAVDSTGSKRRRAGLHRRLKPIPMHVYRHPLQAAF